MEVTDDVRFNGDLTENGTFNITYSGKLFQNNSDEVTVVYGFGLNWENTTEKLMEKTENGFISEIEMLNSDKINFCFRNSNYEWDNNNNANYVAPILPPCLPAFSEDTEKPADDEYSSVLRLDLESLLDELLTPTSIQEFEEIPKLENVQNISQEFDIDALIDSILNPVINFDNVMPIESAPLTVDNIAESNYVQEIEAAPAEKNDNNTEIANDNTALVVTDEDNFLVSPRKLGAFYMIRKKIKLALYKAIVVLPKLLMGEYDTNKNND